MSSKSPRRRSSRKPKSFRRSTRKTRSNTPRRLSTTIAAKTLSQLPPDFGNVKVYTGSASCQITPTGVVCKQTPGTSIDCQQKNNKIKCKVNGTKTTCIRKTGKIECK